ncbi:MAG: PH domain-containing protein [Myxococcales bacterium]|nr:PH domain-containing protein [Myxococcales bacterium]
MSWGILWKREIYLTYARIQDIHLSRGLLERWLGLATIEVQTAAGKSTAEMAIVGVPEFESLRDFLYARMRGARFGQEADAGSVGALPAPGSAAPTLPSPDDPSGGGDAALGVLTDMRDTLVRIRERIERRG